MSKLLVNAFWVVGIGGVAWLVISRIRRTLDPPFAALEFASNPKDAKRVLTAWTDAKRRLRVLVTIAIEFFILIPLYVTAAWTLAAAGEDPNHEVITAASYFVAFAVTAAALAHYVESFSIAVTLIARAPMLVFATRILGWIKYTILALAAVYAIFRAEAYLFLKLGDQKWSNLLSGLVVGTLLIALFAFHASTRLSKSYPPLVALQLAPSRLAAKDILERWGAKGRRIAGRALLLQCAMAVLYGLTLAEIFKRVEVPAPTLDKFAAYLSWLMLIAAACHVAQNLGAFVAVRRRAMGWWVTPMRRLGRVRMALLALALGYSIALLVRVEFLGGYWLGEKIAELGPENPMKWWPEP